MTLITLFSNNSYKIYQFLLWIPGSFFTPSLKKVFTNIINSIRPSDWSYSIKHYNSTNFGDPVAANCNKYPSTCTYILVLPIALPSTHFNQYTQLDTIISLTTLQSTTHSTSFDYTSHPQLIHLLNLTIYGIHPKLYLLLIKPTVLRHPYGVLIMCWIPCSQHQRQKYLKLKDFWQTIWYPHQTERSNLASPHSDYK